MKSGSRLSAVLLAVAFRAVASPYDDLWKDPATEARIQSGILSNRMGDAVLRILGSDGLPRPDATVRIEQTSHAFLFGANIFMLGGFPSPEMNRQYETVFRSLFNAATVPFYWSDLEPEDGKPRFAKDSPPIYRRPPPDAVVEFCAKNGLAMKGHPLVWHQWYPKWRPDDPQAAMLRIERRISEIAARYGTSIPRWEVVNEPCERDRYADKWCNLPEGYVLRSLNAAAKAFPAGARMMLNEANGSWLEFDGRNSPYYRLLREMLDRGARVDEFGMQMHIFSEQAWKLVLAGQRFAPADLFKVLDCYSDFGLPIHITEITIPALPNSPEGERDQAAVARNFYRLWFSHPRIEAITWWNVVDGTAAKGEDKWNAGLVRKDFSPKPAFQALERLIHHDWKTVVEARSDSRGGVAMRGFHGDYTVTVQAGGKTATETFRLKKNASNEWSVRLRD